MVRPYLVAHERAQRRRDRNVLIVPEGLDGLMPFPRPGGAGAAQPCDHRELEQRGHDKICKDCGRTIYSRQPPPRTP